MPSGDENNRDFLFDEDYDKDTTNDRTTNAGRHGKVLEKVNLLLRLTGDS